MAAGVSKFRVKVELQGLKFEIEGDREIGSTIAQNVASQIANVVQPTALLEAPKNGNNGNRIVEAQAIPTSTSRKRRRASTKTGAATDSVDSPALDWNHDAAKWGSPIQSWKQWQKIVWLLAVVEQETGTKDLTSTQMTDIFNLKFRDSGLLTKGNIPRDLGNNPDFFGSVDGRWFLKQGGKDSATQLITEAKGQKATA